MKLIKLSALLISGFTATAQVKTESELERLFLKNISEGKIIVKAQNKVFYDTNTLEILKQLQNSKIEISKPVLIFNDDEVIINDFETLQKIVSDSRQTVTSARER